MVKLDESSRLVPGQVEPVVAVKMGEGGGATENQSILKRRVAFQSIMYSICARIKRSSA